MIIKFELDELKLIYKYFDRCQAKMRFIFKDLSYYNKMKEELETIISKNKVKKIISIDFDLKKYNFYFVAVKEIAEQLNDPVTKEEVYFILSKIKRIQRG